MTDKTITEELTLEYALFDLPSVQHKAGLAGLCLLTESLKRLKVESRPEITFDDDPAQTVTIKLTPKSIKSVFDHFFAPIVKNDGKKDKILPSAKFLETLGMPESWINLWRSVIADVLRAGVPPQQMASFTRRAADRKYNGDAESLWPILTRNTGKDLSSTDAVGTEAVTAEKVPFKSTSQLRFLLMFWPIVSIPYQSSVFKFDSNTANCRFQFDSYLFVTPEIALIEDFVSDYPDFLAEDLAPETIGESTWPIASSVSCPVEGGLRFFAPWQIISDEARRFPHADLVSTVEIAQVKYGKGSPSILSIQSLEPDSGVLKQYENIRDGCWNPIWRTRQIQNFLNGNPWYTEALADFNAYPWELFIQKQGSTPEPIPFFGSDLVRRFRGIENDLEHITESEQMTTSVADDELAVRLYRLMRDYVNRRTQEKSDLDYKAYEKADDGGKKRYREARESVARDAFLQMRGRHDDDFVTYFVGSICSVPHFLPEPDFVAVTNALLTTPQRVKTLSMLALSAHSYLKSSDDEKNKSKS